MSSSSQFPATSSAPWSAKFQEHVSKLKSPEFVLSTLHPVSPSKSNTEDAPVSTNPTQAGTASPLEYAPRARFCIYRGMWASLPENKHNDAPRNPHLYESDMPTFTTDVRMEKVGELFTTSRGQATHRDQIKGSGGGGPVEAVWWVSEVGTQWRIRGRAFVVHGGDIDNTRGDIPGHVTSGVRVVRSEVGKRMRRLTSSESKEEEWSWSREVTGHFGNLSPGMRGTWKNPPPGTPTHGQKPLPEYTLGQKVTSLDDHIARENFRVVVIRPDEVEQTDISDPEKARRWRYTFESAGADSDEAEEKGQWKMEELWP